MKTLPKTLLLTSIVAFVAAHTGWGAEFGGGIIKPISAICFILFYITQLTAKETAIYDAEQRALIAPGRSHSTVSVGHANRVTSGKRSHVPALARAASR